MKSQDGVAELLVRWQSNFLAEQERLKGSVPILPIGISITAAGRYAVTFAASDHMRVYTDISSLATAELALIQ
jgi:hypothetical protein